MMTQDSFGKRLRRYRRNGRDQQNGGALSQARLADLLSEACGIVYSRAAVSDWERGKGQVHKDDRHVLVGLMRVLVTAGGLQTVDEANEWLALGNYRRLNQREVGEIDSAWLTVAAEREDTPLRFMVPSLPSHPIIGRTQLLTQLKSQLFAGHNVALSAINGLPGVGKTTLAALLAHDPDLHTHFPDGILWVGLGRDPDIYHLLGQWGRAVGIADDDLAKMGAIKLRVNAIHDQIKTKQMLLVIDDAWQSVAIEPFKLGGSHSTHILTTRQPPLATAFAGENALRVSELSHQFAVELLNQLAPRVFTYDRAAADEIVRQTGGLPLALVLVGNYLRLQAVSGSQRRIKAALERVLSAENRQQLTQPQPLLDHDAHPSLSTSTPISLTSIIGASDENLTSATQSALRHLALFPPKPNGFSEAAALAIADTTTDALDELVDHGLLELRANERYTLHQSIHDYARLAGSMAADGQERFVRYYRAFADVLAANPNALGEERDNLTTALTIADALNQPTLQWSLVDALFPIFEVRGEYAVLAGYLEQLVERDLPAGDQAKVRLHLGRIAHKVDDIEAVIQQWKRGIELARTANEKDLLITLLSSISSVVSHQQQYDIATQYLNEAITIARETQSWLPLCRAEANLGRLAIIRDQYDRADPHLKNALTIATDHGFHSIACALHNMRGIVAKNRGDMEAAYQHYLSGLQLARQQRLTARVLDQLLNLGTLLNKMQRYEDAILYLEEGLSLAQTFDDSGQIAHLLLDLGLASYACNRQTQADDYLSSAYEIASKTKDYRLLADILSQWGKIELDAQRIDQAQKLFQECLQYESQIRRKAHIVAAANFGLAQIAQANNESALVDEHVTKALQILASTGSALQEEIKAWVAANV